MALGNIMLPNFERLIINFHTFQLFFLCPHLPNCPCTKPLLPPYTCGEIKMGAALPAACARLFAYPLIARSTSRMFYSGFFRSWCERKPMVATGGRSSKAVLRVVIGYIFMEFVIYNNKSLTTSS